MTLGNEKDKKEKKFLLVVILNHTPFPTNARHISMVLLREMSLGSLATYANPLILPAENVN